MGLILKIKGAEAPQDAQILYRDALVSKGTLLLHDFSNRGCTNDFDITNGVFDLSREASNILNVNNGTTFKMNDNRTPPILTAKKGFRMTHLGRNSTYPTFDNGIQLGSSLSSYLITKRPSKLVMIFWVNFDTSIDTRGGAFFESENNSVDNNSKKLLRLFHTNSADGMFNPTFLGIAPKAINTLNKIVQYSVEINGEGTPIKVYVNGNYEGQSTVNNLGYGTSPVDLFIGNNISGAQQDMSSILYRTVIEDLSISGRSAEDLIKEDYNYVNALGKYAGVEKRPFANL